MDPDLVRSVGEYLVRPYWWHGSKRWFPDPMVADTGRSGTREPVTREVRGGSADRGAGAIGSGKSQRGALLTPLERKCYVAHEAACRQPGRMATLDDGFGDVGGKKGQSDEAGEVGTAHARLRRAGTETVTFAVFRPARGIAVATSGCR